jgi:hypothetical protein
LGPPAPSPLTVKEIRTDLEENSTMSEATSVSNIIKACIMKLLQHMPSQCNFAQKKKEMKKRNKMKEEEKLENENGKQRDREETNIVVYIILIMK